MTELDSTDAASAAGDRTTDRTAAETPPHVSGLPVVGSTVAASRDGLAFTEDVAARGDLVSYSAFGEDIVAVFDPGAVETVLVSNDDAFTKGDFEMSFGDLVAPEGLAFASGERWRRQRTALQSAFTPAKIRGYADEMVANTAAMADGWTDGETVAVGDAFATLTLRILTRALFDLDFDAERGAVVREATEAIGAVMDSFGLLSFLPEWVPTRTERRYDRAMAALDALVERLVAERAPETGERDADTGERDDLLSLLVAAADAEETGMDRATVRDQLVTFLFAGHETTATALTYACWLLAGNPDARRRLDAELDSVLGDRDPTFADVAHLDYTERVVTESLRLYPPIYALYREPDEAVTLGGYRIPAGTTLQLATYNVQRDDRWWTAPDEFRPDRWTGASAEDRPEYAYFPFGGGPRHCIGMRFAMTELQLVVATLARRVEFERTSDRDLDLNMGLTLQPTEPVELRVKER